eukprot:gene9408-3308_t
MDTMREGRPVELFAGTVEAAFCHDAAYGAAPRGGARR